MTAMGWLYSLNQSCYWLNVFFFLQDIHFKGSLAGQWLLMWNWIEVYCMATHRSALNTCTSACIRHLSIREMNMENIDIIYLAKNGTHLPDFLFRI
jgi:hypothetical protein